MWVAAETTRARVTGMCGLKSDTVAVFAVLPRYPRYYRGNGIEIHSSTAVMGLEFTVFLR